jgi:hypothetical protein
MMNEIQDRINAENSLMTYFDENLEGEAHQEGYNAKAFLYKKSFDIKSRVFGKGVAKLLVCVENPRNEIDNPVRYCTQVFQTSISSFVALTAVGTLPREYQEHNLLWGMFEKYIGEYRNRVEATLNISPGGWEWLPLWETHNADYFVSIYMENKISAELALQLSGLSEVDFAQMVQEKAMKRDLPIFQTYLKGGEVEEYLPFSKDKSFDFREAMASEIE